MSDTKVAGSRINNQIYKYSLHSPYFNDYDIMKAVK